MFKLKLLFFIFCIIITTSCNNNNKKTVKNIATESIKLEADTIKIVEENLKYFSKNDVARFAISALMFKPSKTVKVSYEDDLYYVSYVRKHDRQLFEYKLKFVGNKIIWANIDGRWRTDPMDEVLTFEEKDKKIIIKTTYSDGSSDTKEFKKGD